MLNVELPNGHLTWASSAQASLITQHSTLNIQHSTFTIHHSTLNIKKKWETIKVN